MVNLPRSATAARGPTSVNSYPARKTSTLHRSIAPSRHGAGNLRERSWRLRCSLRLKARLQNWHLYFFSGAPVLRAVAGDELEAMAGGSRVCDCRSVRPMRGGGSDGGRACVLERGDGVGGIAVLLGHSAKASEALDTTGSAGKMGSGRREGRRAAAGNDG